MQIALVANPAARAGAAGHAAERAAARLRADGVRTAMVSGGSAEETTSLLRRAVDAGVDGVVVAGGDGTVRLALQILAGTDVPLGIVPVGTGNDMAAALGLHELDVDAAAGVVAAGRTRRIDLARVTRADGSTELYATVLAAGFDARVNDRANLMRWPRGGSRYTIAILREFLALRSDAFEVELELEDGTRERWSEPLLMATVGNGRTYGGGIPICPGAALDDGVLDVTVVRPAGRLRLLRLLPRVYAGTHGTIAEVRMRRARRIRLSAPGVNAYADGDPIAALPIEIEPAPGALSVFVR